MFDKHWEEEVHSKRGWMTNPNERMVSWVQNNFCSAPSKLRKDIKILDVGCGQGASTFWLAAQGFSVAALDGSVSAINKIKDVLKRMEFPWEVVVADMNN